MLKVKGLMVKFIDLLGVLQYKILGGLSLVNFTVVSSILFFKKNDDR